jgi:DNA-binding PadR family transcriptional regulator
MKLLSRTEEFILLAVLALGGDAYGIPIRKHLYELTGKKYSIGAIYVPLERLEAKGLLSSYETEPTPERGGRSKRCYQVSAKGITALEEIRQLNKNVWKSFPSERKIAFSQK